MARNASPISNGDFLQSADSITINIGGKDIDLDPRSFSSGSVGFGYSGKVTVTVGGIKVPLQASINLTVIGSKPVAEAA